MASLVQDNAAALTTPLHNPVATVLNLCRLAWYLRAKVLSSKEEAGAWAQDTARPAHKQLISQALAMYRGTAQTRIWDVAVIRRFGHQVLALAATGPAELASGPVRQLQLGSER